MERDNADKDIKTGRLSDAAVMLEYGLTLGEALQIDKFLIDARTIKDFSRLRSAAEKRTVILVAPPQSSLDRLIGEGIYLMELPIAHLTRITLLRMSLFLALLNRHIPNRERVLCLAGSRRSTVLDTLLIMDPAKEFPWLRRNSLKPIRDIADPKVFQRLLEIAVRFAEEGREGKPLGTIFVLGNVEELAPYVSQLMLNPLKGHAKTLRNIQNRQFFESMRELSAVDGAFIIDNEGVAQRAGAYLSAPSDGITVRPGLGARHTAAAAITAHTHSLAITISESSGIVNVYYNGKSILELE